MKIYVNFECKFDESFNGNLKNFRYKLLIESSK